MKAVRFFIFAGTLAMVAGCGNGNSSSTTAEQQTAQERIASVSVMAVTAKDVPQEDVYTSTVEAYATNNIAPQSPSRIQKIYVEVGDFVRAGQIVAKMDDVSLNQTRLSMTNDSLEYHRLKGLYEEGGVSKSDLDAMELKYNVTRSQYENILENTILRSPISGVISARNYDRGDMYTGNPIYVVEQITPVKLLVGISEADYTKVKKNDSVEITVDAIPGRTFAGRISRIYPTIDPSTHTFTSEIQVANADHALRPGMYARVKVLFGVNHSVTVPDNCIVKQQGSAIRSVYVLQEDNTVSERVVTLGRHFEEEYEILSGLGEGEKIVVKGQASLKNGDKVNVQ
ncbi:MAG: efflux RND transporter periplasmic adaptor subunit [Candidatus Cryptobacteroides sp.]|nr:efflux RND transporter periplasmic adaptor subunit [Bacteroidales bacterium]MDY3964168.1 efflux RND transporter periplasmic adaptor subunit [Candidatus Cryptobacteroides sp.]